MFRAMVLVFAFALAANCHTQRRSAERREEQVNCAPGKTPFALCHADQGAEQRHGSCRCYIEPVRLIVQVEILWKFSGNATGSRSV